MAKFTAMVGIVIPNNMSKASGICPKPFVIAFLKMLGRQQKELVFH